MPAHAHLVSLVFLAAAAPASFAQTITTLFAANGGGSPGGVMFFDVEVFQKLEFLRLETNTTTFGNIGASIFITPGTYIGRETSPGAWTLRSTASGVGSGILNAPTMLMLDQPLSLEPGMYGIAIVASAPGLPSFEHRYTNGNSTNQHYANDDLALSLGAAQNIPFAGLVFAPRVWNGAILYIVPCYPDCDDSSVAPRLNVDDFICFINEFASGSTLPQPQQIPHYANCDGGTIAPVLNVDDFICFINRFAQGCP